MRCGVTAKSKGLRSSRQSVDFLFCWRLPSALQAIDGGVTAIELHQLRMSAAFDNAPVLQVKNQIGVDGLLQVVSNEEKSPAGIEPLQGFEHRALVVSVQACRGLIEDENRRFPNGGAGDGN